MKKHSRNALWIYLTTWVIAFLLILLQLRSQGRKIGASAELFITEIAPNKTFLIILHVFFVLLFLLFLAFRYFRRVYKNKGGKTMLKRLMLYFVLPISILYFGIKSLIYLNTFEPNTYVWDDSFMNASGVTTKNFERDGLHRGMSVFGWSNNNEAAISALVNANVEWVAVIPFIYQENEKSTRLRNNRENGQFTRRDSMFIKAIKDLRASGIYVHLKPHVWLGEGWRSNLSPDNDKAWQSWFASYRKNMLHYAKMTELTGAEMLCVGTELRTSIKNQPEAWEQLIVEIREIYSGKLTYAANWHDEYEHITFWNQLDYIGIQAYFPLTKTKSPHKESIKKGWQPHIETLSAFSRKHNKPILFTEVGYKSEVSATIKPWEWSSVFGVLTKKKSDLTQRLAFEALFEEVWSQDWFAGVYIWQWDTRSSETNASKNLDFSPRFKPAENVIAKWFGQPGMTTSH